MIDMILTNTVLPTLSAELINRMIAEQPMTAIEIKVEDNNFIYDFVD
jgi:type VI secretion system protein VasG